MKLRMLAMLLILAIVLPLLALLPGDAAALGLTPPEQFGSEKLTTRVNPLYQDVLKPEDLQFDSHPAKPEGDAQPSAITYVTISQAAQQMRAKMTARATSFTLYITADTSDYEKVIDEVLMQAIAHTGRPKEGDYLMWHYAGLGGNVERTSSGGQYKYTYQLEMAYYTTAAQESQMDTAVANLLRSLNLNGKSNYQKVKAVYDYICSNVTYDEANLNNSAHTLKFTAYAALINKTAVCQGYATLFYRLMLELGIDARVIAGDSGGAHGWNIVKLGSVYYNVDTTWDAGMSEYQFFLRNTENFVGHARYLEYMSTQFHMDYPMAQEDYADGFAGVPEYYFVAGMCGDNAYWGVNRDLELTIVGEGETYSFSRYGDLEDLSPWAFWMDGFETVVIDEGITSVGNALFFNMDNVKSVTLPDSLQKIGDFAFKYCDNLKQITLPEGLLNIGMRAFYQTGLESVTIPDSVTSLSSGAFALNANLREATLGAGLMSGCSATFQNCDALTKVTIPEGITFLGSYMFEGCEALTDVPLPSTLEKIESYALSGTGITRVVLSDRISQLGNNAFSKCNQLTSVVLGSGLTNVGDSAFSNCANLTELTIGEGLPYVSDWMFAYCYALDNVDLPDSVTIIGEYAFFACRALENVTLGDSLDQICSHAFEHAPLTEIILPEGLMRIEEDAFYAARQLTEVTIPSTVYYLNGFGACTGLKQVHFINPNVQTIGEGAFDNCRSLESITIPETVTTIQRDAFVSCESLTEIVIPDSVTSCGSAFRGCIGLETAYINFHGSIAWSCFSGCTSLKNVYISDNVTGMVGFAFTDCTSLESIEIPGSVETLGSGLFNRCTNLKEIHFQGEVPTFAADTFTGVTATAYYPGELHSWTDEVLQNYGGNITWVSTHIHTFTSVVTPPTCTEQGFTTYTCTDCGRVKTGDYVNALGHSFGPWEVTLQPDCVSSGEEQAECQVCGHRDSRPLLPLGHEFADGTCGRCGMEQPRLEEVLRIAGADRIATSLQLADQLKAMLGLEKFNSVIVASALNFPDALTGSYLAAVKNAPILLTYDAAHAQVRTYVEANLAPGGTVYILGGESAVSASFANGLNGFRIQRVAGSDRFGTNLEIMKEAGVSADQPVLIATALNFADSLSASAAGLPMVLVYGNLRPDQKAFLETTSKNFIIIGGTAAVSEELEAELAAIGTVERLAGAGRYQTSVMVAQRFVQNPDAAVLAYARNFPDGLCGGPLAYALGAPLILTDNFDPSEADAYIDGITAGIVAGGTGLISDETMEAIFDFSEEPEIPAE